MLQHTDPLVLLEEHEVGPVESGDEGHRGQICIWWERNLLVDRRVFELLDGVVGRDVWRRGSSSPVS